MSSSASSMCESTGGKSVPIFTSVSAACTSNCSSRCQDGGRKARAGGKRGREKDQDCEKD